MAILFTHGVNSGLSFGFFPSRCCRRPSSDHHQTSAEEAESDGKNYIYAQHLHISGQEVEICGEEVIELGPDRS